MVNAVFNFALYDIVVREHYSVMKILMYLIQIILIYLVNKCVQSLAALFKLAKVLEKELPLAMVGPWSRALARALQLLVVALCRGPNLPWWVQPTVYCPLEKAFFLVSRVLDMALVVRFEGRNPLIWKGKKKKEGNHDEHWKQT